MSDSTNVLIVAVVKKGWGDRLVEYSMQAGASGGTIVHGRGIGIHEQQKLMGICIGPEKEIVFSVVPRDKEESIMAEIVRSAELNKPGNGIAFVLPVEKVAGMVHCLTADCETNVKE